MGDRVHHPSDSPILSPPPQRTPSRASSTSGATPHRTYVVKVPKDQVYRVPPPENAQKFNQLTTPTIRRCNWWCWLIGTLLAVIALLGLTAGIFYLVVRPKPLEYSIDTIDIRGFNVTSLSPQFNVTILANNPNGKIGFRYGNDSSVEILFNNVMLCNGLLPEFYQRPNNLTVFKTTLEGNVIKLRSSDETELVKAEKKRKVPLTVKLVIPLKIKMGIIESGKITVKVDCDVIVDKLSEGAQIISIHCSYHAYVLWSFKI